MSRWLIIGAAFLPLCFADLRMASQPKRNFKVKQLSRRRVSVPFNTSHAVYMEPSDFGYEGLKNQRQNAYDNFLRSNIDNEQDRRNFETEEGRDHLPFRSYEGFSTDAHMSQQHKIPADFPGTNITATPGEPVFVPLRWNNPHASELEVNIWIVENKYVVPIRKPTCSGEGYQDNVFSFTVPTDFNTLGTKVPGFTGCNSVTYDPVTGAARAADCVLQVYAHSVESRTYSMGTPLIVTGGGAAATAQDESQIAAVGKDVELDMSSLQPLCLPSNDPSANIATSVPRHARYVSDQWNHAYQNSDFSPYSGQQPEAISKNMQASCILKMLPGNRGELGKRALLTDNREGFKFQRSLDRKARKLVKKYEEISNSLIGLIGDNMKTEDAMTAKNHAGEMKPQRTENCFRCAETGSTNTKRLTTTTYIPSWQIPTNLLTAVDTLLAPDSEYRQLIDFNTGLVQIYVAAMNDLNQEFIKAQELNISYQGPRVKSYLSTHEDSCQFRKLEKVNGVCTNTNDKGLAAARLAYKQYGQQPWRSPYDTSYTPYKVEVGPVTPLAASGNLAGDVAYGTDAPLPKAASASGEEVAIIKEAEDMHGIMGDSICDDESNPNVDEIENCPDTGPQMFPYPHDLEAEVLGMAQPGQGQVATGAAKDTHLYISALGVLTAACLW